MTRKTASARRPAALIALLALLVPGCAAGPPGPDGLDESSAPIAVGDVTIALAALMAYPAAHPEGATYEALYPGQTEMVAWLDVSGTTEPLDLLLEDVDLAFEIENDATGESIELAEGRVGLRAVRWALDDAPAMPGVGAATGRVVARRTTEEVVLGETPPGYLYLAAPGDANLDGRFDSADVTELFAAGLYETDAPATWLEGDFDSDGRFDSGDLVAAQSTGAYDGEPAFEPGSSTALATTGRGCAVSCWLESTVTYARDASGHSNCTRDNGFSDSPECVVDVARATCPSGGTHQVYEGTSQSTVSCRAEGLAYLRCEPEDPRPRRDDGSACEPFALAVAGSVWGGDQLSGFSGNHERTAFQGNARIDAEAPGHARGVDEGGRPAQFPIMGGTNDRLVVGPEQAACVESMGKFRSILGALGRLVGATELGWELSTGLTPDTWSFRLKARQLMTLSEWRAVIGELKCFNGSEEGGLVAGFRTSGDPTNTEDYFSFVPGEGFVSHGGTRVQLGDNTGRLFVHTLAVARAEGRLDRGDGYIYGSDGWVTGDGAARLSLRAVTAPDDGYRLRTDSVSRLDPRYSDPGDECERWEELEDWAPGSRHGAIGARLSIHRGYRRQLVGSTLTATCDGTAPPAPASDGWCGGTSVRGCRGRQLGAACRPSFRPSPGSSYSCAAAAPGEGCRCVVQP